MQERVRVWSAGCDQQDPVGHSCWGIHLRHLLGLHDRGPVASLQFLCTGDGGEFAQSFVALMFCV